MPDWRCVGSMAFNLPIDYNDKASNRQIPFAGLKYIALKLSSTALARAIA